MQVTRGKVINGRIVVDAELPEGAEVTLIVNDDEETFEVTPELEGMLVASMAEGDRGETIPADELMRELVRSE